MIYVLLGVIGYLLFIFADFNKMKKIHPVFNATFAVGMLLLITSTFVILQDYPVSFRLPGIWSVICIILASLSMGVQFYILFFAIPFTKTYVEIGNYTIVDTGFFGLSRHPGVMWFFLFYFFLWLGIGKMMLLWAGIIWTAMDVLHVYIQDRFIFPRMFKDYDVYIEKVPFLIPTKQSIKDTLRRKV